MALHWQLPKPVILNPLRPLNSILPRGEACLPQEGSAFRLSRGLNWP